MDKKQCVRCKESFPASPDYFHQCKKHPDGLQYKCKQCTKLYNREYYEKHTERLKRYSAEWAKQNAEHRKRYQRSFYISVRESFLAESRERYASDKAFRAHKIKTAYAWSKKNRALSRKYKNQSEVRHPETKRKNKAIRRARARRAYVEPVCPLAVLKKASGCCFYCGKKINLKTMHMDHDLPLSRGGPHSEENILPSCSKCNLQKGNKTSTEYINWLSCQTPTSSS